MNRSGTRDNNETVTTNEDTRRTMADDTEFGPRKTIIILAIVAGCFAILWPKIFYPMLNTPVNTMRTPAEGPGSIRQERRLPLHAGGLHPALQQRGRAIPSSHIVPKVDGRPDHVVVEKIRPPLGAAGRVVPTQNVNNSMGIIMPLYTLGIFLFFLYTIAKVMRKNSDNEIYADYQNTAAEREFRAKVFNPEILTSAMTGVPCYRNERSSSPIKIIPTIEELKEQAAGDIEIDQLRQRLVDTEAAMERIVVQMGSLTRTVVHTQSPHQDAQIECGSRSCCSRNNVEEFDESAATVQVVGMEMTARCEDGHRISRPTTPIISHTPRVERESTPPKPIYLEGALPPQCELLVTDSETQAENSEDDADAPIVLSGKMTLSLISHDQNQAEIKDFEANTNRNVTDDTSTRIERDENLKATSQESWEVDEASCAESSDEMEESELDEEDDNDENYDEDDDEAEINEASDEDDEDENNADMLSEESNNGPKQMVENDDTKIYTDSTDNEDGDLENENEEDEDEDEDEDDDDEDEDENEVDDSDRNDDNDSKEEEDEEDEEEEDGEEDSDDDDDDDDDDDVSDDTSDAEV